MNAQRSLGLLHLVELPRMGNDFDFLLNSLFTERGLRLQKNTAKLSRVQYHRQGVRTILPLYIYI